LGTEYERIIQEKLNKQIALSAKRQEEKLKLQSGGKNNKTSNNEIGDKTSSQQQGYKKFNKEKDEVKLQKKKRNV